MSSLILSCSSSWNDWREWGQKLTALFIYLQLYFPCAQMYMSVPWKMVAASTSVLTVQAPTGVSATLDIYCSQMEKVAEIRVSCFYFFYFSTKEDLKLWIVYLALLPSGTPGNWEQGLYVTMHRHTRINQCVCIWCQVMEARILNGSLLHAPSEFKGGGRHEYTAKAFNIPYTGLWFNLKC